MQIWYFCRTEEQDGSMGKLRWSIKNKISQWNTKAHRTILNQSWKFSTNKPVNFERLLYSKLKPLPINKGKTNFDNLKVKFSYQIFQSIFWIDKQHELWVTSVSFLLTCFTWQSVMAEVSKTHPESFVFLYPKKVLGKQYSIL